MAHAEDEIHASHPYRRRDEPSRPRSADASAAARAPDARWLLAAVVGTGAWLAATGWREHRLNAAVGALPLAVQQQSYARTYAELSTVCRDRPALAEHCREEAELIVRFPQCNDDCWRLARPFFAATK